MQSPRFVRVCVTTWVAVMAIAVATKLPADTSTPNMLAFDDPTGQVRTFTTKGTIDLTNPFFQVIGTNGRSCGSCHQASDGWTITPAHVQARFDATSGLDPIFAAVDGTNAPNADRSTVDARRAASSMLLSKGLIRIGIGVPANAEFELIGVDDPYGFASAGELSLFRRPLPATNLGFLATVMWDGRETFAGQPIAFDLSDQANSATLGHAQAARPLTLEQRQQMVDFETATFTAQTIDIAAGPLRAQGATGGPVALSQQPFFIGINDVLGPGFDRRALTLFDAWRNLDSSPNDPYTDARQAVARGEEIFNTHPITISGVRGVNDALGIPELAGTCTTCHDAPNVGNHSTSLPLDLGLTTEARRTADQPLYTVRNKTTGEIVKTTDPGRALITGKWKHMSTFKGPILRGLAARAPYFHNGSAASLADVVDFYDQRFALGLSAQEKSDLAAFLRSL